MASKKKSSVSTFPVYPNVPNNVVGSIPIPVKEQTPTQTMYVTQKFLEYADNAFQKQSNQTSTYGSSAAGYITHTHSFLDLNNVKLKNLSFGVLEDVTGPGGLSNEYLFKVYVNGTIVQTVYYGSSSIVISNSASFIRMNNLGIFSEDLFKGSSITIEVIFGIKAGYGGTTYKTFVNIDGYRIVEEIQLNTNL